MLDRKPKITPDRIKSMQSQCKLLKGSRGENIHFMMGSGGKGKRIFIVVNGRGHFWLSEQS